MSFRQTLPLLTQNSKSKSSTQWISRQLRDPYVKKRITDPVTYRSRSAFKLLEINDKMGHFLDYRDVQTIVDLGAAPGGWSQVVSGKLGWRITDGRPLRLERKEKVEGFAQTGGFRMKDEDLASCDVEKCISKRKSKSNEEQVEKPLPVEQHPSVHIGRGTIFAVDLLPIVSIPGVHIICGDFLHDSTTAKIRNLLVALKKDVVGHPDGKADVILSDMAANSTGNTAHDIQCSLDICEAVFEFARVNLRSAGVIGRKNGGVLLVKFFAHPLLDQFRKNSLEPNFHHVRYIKPDSSRSASREGYFLCQGWNPQ